MKVGIIGLGGIASNMHVPLMRANGKFDIVAAADVVPDTGRAAALGIPNYYDDYRRLLADPQIDTVILTTPHDLHEEQCIEALQAGKHLLVEKPIARNLREAEGILEAADKAGTTFMVGFCERFYPIYHHLKDVLSSNTLGELLTTRIDHYQNFDPAPGSWWRSAGKVGGGCVIGSGIHRLDLLRWYFGEPVSVFAKSVRMPERLEAEACVHAVIEFDSGVIANFSCNWASYQYLYYEGFSVAGKDGLACTDGQKLMLGTKDVECGQLRSVEIPACEGMYDHFADCIESGKTPLTSGDEGYKSLRLVRAIYKSMACGSEVSPADVTE